jgi:predicted ABC-type sugar transport system permease subunit
MLGLIVSLIPNYSFLAPGACLFTGLILGLINGAFIAFLRLPPFIVTLVYRLLNPLGFVAIKMGRQQGGPSRTGGGRAHI